jgi:hypothetical protein
MIESIGRQKENMYVKKWGKFCNTSYMKSNFFVPSRIFLDGGRGKYVFLTKIVLFLRIKTPKLWALLQIS